jgi:hypothetical protein
MFEDNLSYHKTDEVMRFWENELDQFAEPRFFPANMTMILQPIDRHIDIRYKEAVYREYRRNCFQRLEASKYDKTLEPFSLRDKRIMITRAIGDIHDKLSNTGVFERAFSAAGTLMPVEHLVNDSTNETSPPKDYDVKLQHLNEYIYLLQKPNRGELKLNYSYSSRKSPSV